jgi:hypothetical protein
MSPQIELFNLFLRKPQFFYGYISKCYPLIENHFELLKDDLFWELIATNETINFTIPLVEKYKELLNKEDLSYNRSIYNNHELVNYLGIQSNPLFDLNYLLEQAILNKARTDSDYHPAIRYHNLSYEEIEKNKDLIDWGHFSSNALIKWNKQLIYRYADRLWLGEQSSSENSYSTDALELYNNEAVPWDVDLLLLFENKILINQLVISQFLQNRTLIKNIKPLVTEDFFVEVLVELKFKKAI